MSEEIEVQPQEEKQTDSGLFTSEERWVCEQVSTGKALWSKRALALLAIDAGASDEVAGETSGLRATQVKYWVDAFRRQRMDIFPVDILAGIDTEAGGSASSDSIEPTEETTSEESSGKTKKAKNKKSKKKPSKGKKGKGSKKRKQNKKRKKKKKKSRGKKKSK